MAIDKAVDSTVLDGYFGDIADAIRGKNGDTATYTPSEMAEAIDNLPSSTWVKTRIEAPSSDPGTPAFDWPEDLTEIGQYAFYHYPNYQGVDVVIPEGVETIGDSAFYSSMLRSVVLPSTARFVGGCYFQNCIYLESADLSRITSRTQLGGHAFRGDTALLEVILPANLSTIQSNVWAGCTACLKYDFSRCESIPSLSSTSAFNNINANAQIIVPDDLYDAWIAATNWSNSNIVGHIVKASEV